MIDYSAVYNHLCIITGGYLYVYLISGCRRGGGFITGSLHWFREQLMMDGALQLIG